MTTERQAFIEAIRARPDDDLPGLAFADWLEEHGEEARAEYIRLQADIRNGQNHPCRDVLKRQEELEKQGVLPLPVARDDNYDWNTAEHTYLLINSEYWPVNSAQQHYSNPHDGRRDFIRHIDSRARTLMELINDGLLRNEPVKHVTLHPFHTGEEVAVEQAAASYRALFAHEDFKRIASVELPDYRNGLYAPLAEAFMDSGSYPAIERLAIAPTDNPRRFFERLCRQADQFPRVETLSCRNVRDSETYEALLYALIRVTQQALDNNTALPFPKLRYIVQDHDDEVKKKADPHTSLRYRHHHDYERYNAMLDLEQADSLSGFPLCSKGEYSHLRPLVERLQEQRAQAKARGLDSEDRYPKPPDAPDETKLPPALPMPPRGDVEQEPPPATPADEGGRFSFKHRYATRQPAVSESERVAVRH